MKYSTKVKKASKVLTAIQSLKADESISIMYKGDTYKISAFNSKSSMGDRMSYSVWSGFRGMNVSKVGRTSLSLYTYDMMSQRTTYRLNLLECTIVE